MADPQLPKGYENFKPSTTPLPKGYEQYSPIQLNPETAGRFGSELDVPQTKSDVENVVAPYVGRLAAKAPPMLGSYYGPGGTMIGTGISQALKATFPKVFGEPSSNILEPGITDLITNNAIPAALEGIIGLISKGVQALPATGLLRNFPATREGAVREMTSQILSRFQQPESQILEKGADVAEANLAGLKGTITSLNRSNPPQSVVSPLTGQQSLQFHPAVQQAMQDLENTFGKNKVGRQLVNLQKDIQAGVDVAGSQTYKQIADTALADLTHVRNWKLAAGPEGVQDLAINKLLQAGAGKEGILDSGKILGELAGKKSEIYSEAISPQTLSDFKDMVNEIHSQQAGHGISDAIIKYSKGRLLWASGLFGGIHGAFTLPGIAAAGTTVTNSMLARAMQNPETAQIVVQALRTPANSPQAQMLSQSLASIWKAGAAATEAAAEK